MYKYLRLNCWKQLKVEIDCRVSSFCFKFYKRILNPMFAFTLNVLEHLEHFLFSFFFKYRMSDNFDID